MYRVGIVGCGSIAKFRHAPEYKANAETEIVGFYDPHFDRVNSMIESFGGVAYESFDAMIADKNIDIISVCSSNVTHADYTMKALNAGKNVLCEKPMATSIEDARAMVDIAKKTGKRLFIGQNQRITKSHEKVKELISSGAIGKVLSFSTVFGHKGPESWCAAKSSNTWFFKKDKAGFGSFGDLGIHKIDLIRYLLGDEVKEVYSIQKTLDKKFPDGNLIEVDDNSIEMLEFEKGTIGTVTTSWTHYACENNQTYIYGEKGIIKLYVNPDCPLEVLYNDGKVDKYNLDQIQTNDNQTSSGVIDLVINSIKSGAKSVLDADDILKSMEVVFACAKSAKMKAPVLINK